MLGKLKLNTKTLSNFVIVDSKLINKKDLNFPKEHLKDKELSKFLSAITASLYI